MNTLLKITALLLVVVCSAEFVSSRFCTKLKAEKTVRSYVESGMCNKSYEIECGWFASKKCVEYDVVPCMVEKNRTVTRYKVVEECCQGFVLNPINNITCIRPTDLAAGLKKQQRLPEERKESLEEVTEARGRVEEKEGVTVSKVTSAPQEPPNVPQDPPKSKSEAVNKKFKETPEGNTSANSSSDATAHGQILEYEEDDSLLFGLSHGAYAGIICALVFLICVIILIGFNIRKRHVRSTAKKHEKNHRMEMNEKLMPAQA